MRRERDETDGGEVLIEKQKLRALSQRRLRCVVFTQQHAPRQRDDERTSDPAWASRGDVAPAVSSMSDGVESKVSGGGVAGG